MEEITEESDNVEITTYRLPNFKIRMSDKGYEKITEKAKLTEADLVCWVHQKMRSRGTAKPGSFETESKKFLEHIFKGKLEDLRKQKKLTE